MSAAPESGRRAAGGVLAAACVSALVVNANTSALMYVTSLFFQNPDGLGLNAFQAGLATLPAAAG